MAGGGESEVLNAVVAPDIYSDLFSIQGTPIMRFLVDVVNQPIYWQLKRGLGGGGGGTWDSVEVFMLPGSRTLVRAGTIGIRIRAATTLAKLAGAAQAVVTIEAVK